MRKSQGQAEASWIDEVPEARRCGGGRWERLRRPGLPLEAAARLKPVGSAGLGLRSDAQAQSASQNQVLGQERLLRRCLRSAREVSTKRKLSRKLNERFKGHLATAAQGRRHRRGIAHQPGRRRPGHVHAVQQSAADLAETGASQTHSAHGEILSLASDGLELGFAEVHQENEDTHLQRFAIIIISNVRFLTSFVRLCNHQEQIAVIVIYFSETVNTGILWGSF